MQSTTQLNQQLQQIAQSFIQASSYDPTTLYLNNTVFDRDEFKKLKKEGFLELDFHNQHEKRYVLSNKGKKLINLA